jgi:hypothetical protein
MSRLRRVALGGVLTLTAALPLSAQAQPTVQPGSAQGVFERVFFLGSDLFGDFPQALAESAAEQLTGGLAVASGTVPRLSSAGFSFSVDSVTGEPVLRTNSLGSVFVDRSLTNGKGVWSIGFSFQRAEFDTIQGESLESGIPVYEERGVFPDGGEIYSQYLGVFDINTSVALASASYGLTDRVDVSVTIPILHVEVTGEGTRNYDVMRDYVLAPDVLEEFYPGGQGRFPLVRAEYSGTGLGDIGLAAKYGLANGARGGAALVGEVRLPTGKKENAMGAGKATVRGSFVGSARLTESTTVHANAGFTGGGIANGFIYAAGIDQTLLPSHRLTASFNLMGDVLRDRPTGLTQIPVLHIPYNPGNPRSRDVTVSTWGFTDFGTVALTRGAFGVKFNLGNGFLLVGSAMFRLNENGVQSKVTPIVGLERVWGR